MEEEAKAAVPNESRSGALIAVIIVFTALIVLTASVRLVAKLIAKLKISLDDYFIFFTTALNIVANAFDLKACTSGFGQHAAHLELESEIEALKYGQLAVGLAGIAYWAAKMSICLFILQIVRGTTHNKFRAVIYVLMGIVTATSFISLLLWGLQANPFPRSWDPRIPGTSQDPQIFLNGVYFNYAMNIFINVLYSLSPLYFLWSVQMDRKKKAIIFALIGSGSLIIAISSLNIAYAHDFLNRTDPTWVLVNEFLCDIIERNFTVVVANLPGLWMLATQLRERYTTYRSRGGTKPGTFVSRPGASEHRAGTHTSVIGSDRVAKQSEKRKDPWRRIDEEQVDLDDDSYPLRHISADGQSGTSLGGNGGISVHTEIVVSEERRMGARAV